MTAIELTPATRSHLARLAGLADVDAFGGPLAELPGMFEVWLAIAVDELEAQRDRELRPLAAARLLLDKVAVHLGTPDRPVPSMEEDPSGEQLLEAARRVSAALAKLEVLEALARAVDRLAASRPAPRVQVDLFSKGEQLPTVWLDDAPHIGEVLDLGIDGVPCCRVVSPAVRRGPGHVEVHVLPHVPMSEGGEF
jgi:hypothetical protein